MEHVTNFENFGKKIEKKEEEHIKEYYNYLYIRDIVDTVGAPHGSVGNAVVNMIQGIDTSAEATAMLNDFEMDLSKLVKEHPEFKEFLLNVANESPRS